MLDDKDPNAGAGLYERRWERYKLNRQGMLLTVNLDLAVPKTRPCRLTEISLGNATFTVNTAIGLPSHYYLSVVGIAARIGCAEIYRNNEFISVQFIKEIDQELLHSIVRSDYFTGGVANRKKETRPYMVGVEKTAIGSALA
ncbi:PilZ domain-containing protein [Rhizobium sp. TRM95111]|uniref:PilZ domain-containing protein n=1 Tax=Rhizobium alarense TaxID=2846851 RepID=UPI001F1CCE23|nr:PilZ domain-containing protein [Rhizobium alarense]MCF3642734.1 PilZ domain-containing protein [Rhizobium alarense]